MNSRILTIILYLVLIILLINVYNAIENKAVFFMQWGDKLNEELHIENIIILITDDNKTETTAETEYQANIQREKAVQKAVEERRSVILRIETTTINNYPFDVVTLSQSQKSELDTIADILNYYSDINVIIVGHTCEIGSKNINLRKGLKRAETGKEYLIEKGIASERVSVESKGKTQPLIPNISRENRKQNRRIEFVVE